MIERLLAAEGALERDELDHAQRLFGQVAEADPRNAIAVVGLARVLARRGDIDAARELVAHALEIDPDEAAARRLLDELDRASAPEPVAPSAFPAPPGDREPVSAHASGGLLGWLRGLFRRR
ncbi:MAG TPA: tetratricopeptide repeat protein [Patescibacteria group bacterium]|jgi:thioredoxin-like negative regulator of GroEL|nr:tetratricopeptide repeat protein [Patescibacteria group bacterium]